MKKLNYIIVLIISGLTFGCGENYLEKTNLNSVNVESFYKSQEDAVKAINGAYSVLQHRGLYKRVYFTLDYLTGDFSITEGGFQYSNLPGFRFTPAESNLVTTTWETCFLGVARTNVVIEKVPEIEMDEAVKTRIIAEARFLRGVFYFHLVTMYGGVPVIDEVVSSPDSKFYKPERSSVGETWAFIEEDFKFAAANLPNFTEYSGNDLGRASAGSAQGYLGKTYLYQGKHNEARNALKPIIDGQYGPYSLMANFEDNFTDKNENNSESLFEIQFFGGVGNVWAGDDSGGETESTYQGTEFGPGKKVFANAYPSDELNAFFDSYPEEEAMRRPFSIARVGDTWSSWDSVSLDNFHGRIITAGGESGVRKNNLGPDEVRLQSAINVRVLRYSDVLLMFAEAENEANGPTADAYAAINEVRERALVSPLPTGLSKEEFFSRIKDERRLEFSFEQTRYFDLIRWGEGETMLGFVKGKNELMPIPESEIVLNPNLQQNPGWN